MFQLVFESCVDCVGICEQSVTTFLAFQINISFSDFLCQISIFQSKCGPGKYQLN